jgi:hypothetical protein
MAVASGLWPWACSLAGCPAGNGNGRKAQAKARFFLSLWLSRKLQQSIELARLISDLVDRPAA